MPESEEGFLAQLTKVSEYPYFWQILGVVLFIGIAYVLWLFIKCRNKPIQVFINEAGIVEVSRSAFVDIVCSACAHLGIDDRPKVRCKVTQGVIHLKIHLRLLKSEQSLNDLSAQLQSYLKQVLKEKLGIDEVGRIDIKVTHITSDALTIARLDEARPSLRVPTKESNNRP